MILVWAALSATVPAPPASGACWGTVAQAGGVHPPPPAAPETPAGDNNASPPDAPWSTHPPPPPPASWRPRRYGDQGTSEVALALGYSSLSGFLAGGGFRHFVLDGLAPGIEATYFGGGTLTSRVGLMFGTLRLVPIRTRSVALVLTGRAGRVLLSNHEDGWGAGGGGGVIVFLGGSANIGLEVGYEALRLLPASFCADLRSCVIHGPVLGLRLSF